MYKLRTTKQLKYFDEVIRLHYEKGYGEDRISTLLPVGHTTVSRWIAIFASQNGVVPRQEEKCNDMKQHLLKSQERADDSRQSPEAELNELRASYARLQMELRRERTRADLLDEMINVGESMFGVPIRKKVGAKQ